MNQQEEATEQDVGVEIPAEVWVILSPEGREVHAPESALLRLAELAYRGALPGTSAERWYWLPDDEHDDGGYWCVDCPWRDS